MKKAVESYYDSKENNVSKKTFKNQIRKLKKNGKKEGVGITSDTSDDYGFVYAKVWYITDKVCLNFLKHQGRYIQIVLDYLHLRTQ